MKLLRNWKLVVDKFQAKLSARKCKNLSFCAILTLVKAVLGSLSLCYFSIFRVPKKIVEELESLRRRFRWDENVDKRKICWVAWSINILQPKYNKGLGVVGDDLGGPIHVGLEETT